MKSFFQRIHDSQSGASRSASKDPYNTRLPPTQPDPERSRPKTTTGHPEIVVPGSSARRHGEGKYDTSGRAHRPTDAYHATPYHYATIPSTSKPPYTSSRHPVVSNSVAQAPPQSQAQTSSRQQPHRSQPEIYDPRTELLKRNAVAPSPQSSFERGSGNEDGAKASRHGRARTSQAPTVPSATPEIWLPPPQQHPHSSRRHREKENDKGKDVYRERDKGTPENHRDKERDKGKERDKEKERDRERERAKEMSRERERPKEGASGKSRERERERTRERENLDRERRKEPKGEGPFHREYKTMPKSSQRDLNDPRAEEGDSSDSSRWNPVAASSGHRRHRRDEGTPATAPSARKPYHEPSPLAKSAVTPPLEAPLQPTVVSSSSDPRGPNITPTPRAMPVHLPAKESKLHKPHHDKTQLAAIDVPQGALSGSDTERATRRELRHRTTNHASNLRSHHREIAAQVSDIKPLKSSLKPQTGYNGRFRELNTQTDKKFSESRTPSAGRPFSRLGESPPQKLTDNRPDYQPGASAVAGLPTDKVRRESTAQFASVSLQPDIHSTSARLENQDRTHTHDVLLRSDGTPPSHSRSHAQKDLESASGRPLLPAAVEKPAASLQPAASGYANHSRELDTRPMLVSTASQQAALAPPRSAVRSHNLDDNHPTAPQSIQAHVTDSGSHSNVPPSAAHLNLPSATQVGLSGTSYLAKSTGSQSSGIPLTRSTEPSSVGLSHSSRPQTSTSRTYHPSESEGRSLELLVATPTAGDPPSSVPPVIPLIMPSRVMRSRDDRSEVQRTDRPMVNQTPSANVSSQPQTARHPTSQVPPMQQTSSSKIVSKPDNMNGVRIESTHAPLTILTPMRDAADRNMEFLSNVTISQPAQTSSYRAKASETSSIAVGSKQDFQEGSAVPRTYTSASATAKSVNDSTRLSEVRSPAPTRVSQLIAGFEARAPLSANPPQLAAGLSVQRPATALATRHDTIEKASAPQIYVTGPQMVPSEMPNRGAVERTLVPQVHVSPPQIAPATSFGQPSEARVALPTNASASLSVPRPSTAMGSRRDVIERSLTPQTSSIAPQIVSRTSYDQTKSSMNNAPSNTEFVIHRPSTTAAGSQQEVGAKNPTSQLYGASQVALGEPRGRTIPAANFSQLPSILSDQRPSVSTAPGQGNVELPTTLQVPATSSQAVPGSSHDYATSSDSRPTARVTTLVNAELSASRNLAVSTAKVIEKVPSTQIYTQAPVFVSGTLYGHTNPPAAELASVAKAPQLRGGPSTIDSKALPHVVPQVPSAVSQPPELSYENDDLSEMHPSTATLTKILTSTNSHLGRAAAPQLLRDYETHSANLPQVSTGSSTQPPLRLQQAHSERHAVPQQAVSSPQISPMTQVKLPETRSIPEHAPPLNVAPPSQSAPVAVDLKRDNAQSKPTPQTSTQPSSKTQLHHPKLAEILSPHPPSKVSHPITGLSSRFPIDEMQQGIPSNPSQLTSHDTISRPLTVESSPPLPASTRTNVLPAAGQPHVLPSTNLTSKQPSPATKTLHSRSSSSKLHSQTPPSPAHPTPPSRLSPSHIAKSNDIRSTEQSHAPAIPGPALQHSPSHVPSSHMASKEPVRISPAPARQHTPDPTSKPLTHRSSSNNAHSHIYSRPNEPQTLPRTTQASSSSSYPSALYRPESRTPYPEAPSAAHPPNVANPRTFDAYQYETRITSQPSSQPQTSTVPPGASSSRRPYPKSYEPVPQRTQRVDSSRNRELQMGLSATIASPPQLEPRSGISVSRNALPQPPTRHQQPVSLLASTVPPPTQQVADESARIHTHQLARSDPAPHTTSASTRDPVSTAGGPLQAPLKIHSMPSEESILRTPSSLAPSMLKPTTSRTSIPASMSSQQESRKKGGIFGIFRSKTPEQQPKYEVWHPSTSTKAPNRNDLYSKTESSTKFGTTSDHKIMASLSSRGKVPPPITVPIPIPPTSGRKSPGNKVFTPFRYLTSKRNRTMSAASVEAVDGTAPNTVVGSPTVSMHSQTPLQPPLRDPLVATQEWRNQEEAAMRGRGNGKYRRQRPGVVFDVSEEPAEDKQRLRPARPRTPAQPGPSRSS